MIFYSHMMSHVCQSQNLRFFNIGFRNYACWIVVWAKLYVFLFWLWILVFRMQNDFLIEVFWQYWSYPQSHFYTLLYPVHWLLSWLCDSKRQYFLLEILNSLKIILNINFNFCSWSLILKCLKLLFFSFLRFKLLIVWVQFYFIFLFIWRNFPFTQS